MRTTGKEPKKESAMMAPATGKREKQPRTMLFIFVAAMFFTLYFVIRYTIKFDAHPPATRERPIRVPAWKKKCAYIIYIVPFSLDQLKNGVYIIAQWEKEGERDLW